MKEKVLKNKTVFIVAAAIVLAAIGFAAGMMVRSVTADDRGSYIDAEQAKSIALESVGVSSSKATFTKVQLDETDRPAIYDIDFYTSANAYDFEINAVSGEIEEKSSEAITSQSSAILPSSSSQTAASQSAQDSSTQATSPTQTQPAPTTQPSSSASEYIGVAKAKSIAKKDAGVSSATFTKEELDSDDGVKIYEIEFISGNREYDYSINAYTGKILERDSERIDDDYDD